MTLKAYLDNIEAKNWKDSERLSKSSRMDRRQLSAIQTVMAWSCSNPPPHKKQITW